MRGGGIPLCCGSACKKVGSEPCVAARETGLRAEVDAQPPILGEVKRRRPNALALPLDSDFEQVPVAGGTGFHPSQPLGDCVRAGKEDPPGNKLTYQKRDRGSRPPAPHASPPSSPLCFEMGSSRCLWPGVNRPLPGSAPHQQQQQQEDRRAPRSVPGRRTWPRA